MADRLWKTAAIFGHEYAVGISLILLVDIVWTVSNYLTQDVYEGGFDKTFFISYAGTSALVVFLLPFFWGEVAKHVGLHTTSCKRRSKTNYDILPSDSSSDAQTEPQSPTPPDASPEELELDSAMKVLSTQETVRLAFVFSLLFFFSNWAVTSSLKYTSVASATVMASMSGLFTLLIGQYFGVETFTTLKVAAVAASFGGVLLVSLSDSKHEERLVPSQPKNRILGDFFALLSALLYACYVTLLKLRLPSSASIDMRLFFGFAGLFTMITCWPIGIALHIFDIERFSLPVSGHIAFLLLMNIVMILIGDYAYVLALLKTTPIVTTIGMSLTIPFSIVGDALIGKPATGVVILGAFIVLSSFVAVGWENASPNNAHGTAILPGAVARIPLSDSVSSERMHEHDA